MSKLHFAHHMEYVPCSKALCGVRVGSLTSLPEKVTCLNCQKYSIWQDAMQKYQYETSKKVIPIGKSAC